MIYEFTGTIKAVVMPFPSFTSRKSQNKSVRITGLTPGSET
jgi:hypothetical protein